MSTLAASLSSRGSISAIVPVTALAIGATAGGGGGGGADEPQAVSRAAERTLVARRIRMANLFGKLKMERASPFRAAPPALAKNSATEVFQAFPGPCRHPPTMVSVPILAS